MPFSHVILWRYFYATSCLLSWGERSISIFSRPRETRQSGRWARSLPKYIWLWSQQNWGRFTYTGCGRSNSHFWRGHCSGCGGGTVMGVVSLYSCGLAIFRQRHGLVGRAPWFRCRTVFQEQWICDRETKELSVGTSDLVDVLPFQIEKRFCCGFLTCELPGQH